MHTCYQAWRLLYDMLRPHIGTVLAQNHVKSQHNTTELDLRSNPGKQRLRARGWEADQHMKHVLHFASRPPAGAYCTDTKSNAEDRTQ